MTIVGEAELGFVPVIRFLTGTISWVTDNLHCSNGFVVLHCAAPNPLTEWIHAWKLEGQADLHFLCTKGLSASGNDNTVEDAAVAAGDSTMHALWRSKQGDGVVSCMIESIAIAAGETRNSKTTRMPDVEANARLPPCTIAWLVMTGSHLLMTHHVEDEGPFPGIGLGVCTFCRFTLSQTDFVPSFEDGTMDVNHDRSGCASNCILCDECSVLCKKISFNGATGKASLEDGFRCPAKVVLSTPTSVFAHDDDSEFITLDEHDLESGKKLRTLETGVRSHQLPYMFWAILNVENSSLQFLEVLEAVISFRPFCFSLCRGLWHRDGGWPGGDPV